MNIQNVLYNQLYNQLYNWLYNGLESVERDDWRWSGGGAGRARVVQWMSRTAIWCRASHRELARCRRSLPAMPLAAALASSSICSLAASSIYLTNATNVRNAELDRH